MPDGDERTVLPFPQPGGAAARAGLPAAYVPAGFDVARLASHQDGLGLAVSGGGDSVALAVLCAEHLSSAGQRLLIVSVDHGLRAGSQADLAAVEALAKRLGLPFIGVRLAPAGPRSMAWARHARYAALHEVARAHCLSAVATAHTLDDVAESFLLRAGRRSGLKGLAAMAPDVSLDGLRVVRPLLDVRREELRRVLTERGIDFRDDPSNSDDRFARARVRKALAALEAADVGVAALAASARHLTRASAFVEREVDALWRRAARVDRSRVVRLDAALYRAAAAEPRLRLLSRAVELASGSLRGPRWRTLIEIDRAIVEGRNGHGGNARVLLRDTVICVAREVRPTSSARQPLHAGTLIRFDNRFEVETALQTPPCDLVFLGRHARALVGADPDLYAGAPALWSERGFEAAPTLGIWRRGWPRKAVRIEAMR